MLGQRHLKVFSGDFMQVEGMIIIEYSGLDSLPLLIKGQVTSFVY